MKEHVSTFAFKNVVIDAVSEGKHRFQFTVDSLELKRIITTNEHDVVFSTEWQVDPAPVLPDSVFLQVKLDEVQFPDYCPAMGDAAQKYCEELTDPNLFRWHSVYAAMLEARQK